MFIYEVNLKVKPEIQEDFLIWLREHVEQMLELDCFLSAELYQSQEADNEDEIEYVAQYEVKSREELEDYFEKHAADMRQKGFDAFGEDFQAQRRILELL